MKNKDRAISLVEQNYREMERVRHLQDLNKIMQTVEGRRFVIELLDTCRVYKDNWTPSAEIHKFEGMRRVGLQILADIESLGIKGLELYHTAQKEYYAHQMDVTLQRQTDIDKLSEGESERG